MRHVFDGLMSLLCALATLGLCGVPAWCSHLAIRYGLVPTWLYAIIGIFGFMAILLAFDFLRKAVSGVAPLNERRR